MKPYFGIKKIYAEPETRDGVEGYRVAYAPSGDQQKPYYSWSPKEAFEKAYRPFEQLDWNLKEVD